MISITPNAAAQIQAMLKDRPEATRGDGLRLNVEKGGCSGMQYAISFDARNTDDHVFAENGAEVLVDPDSLPFVDGSTVDYAEGLTAAGFKILNPNARRSCGCGTSFEA